ncbi:DUF4249 domain-containing protein [Chitinophaga sp. Cy-1792]|uniref:DUF4249 domain-containing protein n=1 Tax=Chitinophaga sp. Cy-1792 TaxID=2608339 RepID=UPI0014224F1C|nr:DUF4249 domain-containing protein [Chitinophaga sp. Cy-1792]
MRYRHIFLLLTLLAILSMACEKPVNITLVYEGNKLVVNTMMQQDSPVYVRVTRSVPVNIYDESAFEELPDVTVSLTDEKGTVMALSRQQIQGKWYYVSSQPATRGHRYKVAASAAGLTPVEAADTLPAKPQAAEATAQRGSNRIKFILKDNPGSHDYYQIRVFNIDTANRPLSALYFKLDPAFNNNLVDIISTVQSTSLIMSDSRFDGREVTFVLQTQDPVPTTGKLMVEVTALSYDAWQYLKTATAQAEGNGDIVSEPVRVFTNVINGYGIVAGINANKLVFKVD